MKINNKTLCKALVSLSLSGGIVMNNFSFNYNYVSCSNAETYNAIISSKVFSKQDESQSCTAAAVGMMLRNYGLIHNLPYWQSLTEAKVRKNCADWENIGLSWDLTVDNIHVTHKYVSAYDSIDLRRYLITLLKSHPEGITIYDEKKPHAVFLTDYTNGRFFCSDPAWNVSEGRIPIENSLVNLENIDAVWYIDSQGIDLNNAYIDETIAPVTTTAKADTPEKATTTSKISVELKDALAVNKTNTSLMSKPDQSDTISYTDYYVSSLIAANWRSEPNYYFYSVMDTAEIDEIIHVEGILDNGFAYGIRAKDNSRGYINISTISQMPKSSYSYGCAPSYYVSSTIGANVRNLNFEKIECIDTFTEVCWLYSVDDYAFCEMFYNGRYISGLIYQPLLSPLY